MLKIPTTRATTAYGYLTAIAKLVLEEPKRLDMSLVVMRGAGIERYITERFWANPAQKVKTPSCGTVGCIAGWALTLAGQTSENEYNMGMMDEARELLGLDFVQEAELFMPKHLTGARHTQGKAHAKATVKHIKAFQAKYAAQLKATKIVK